MSVSKLPSGRWRTQVWDPSQRRNVSAGAVLGESGSYPTKTAAKQARERAREMLETGVHCEMTVRSFWERWTTDPLFARPKDSTNVHNRERTRGFVERHGGLEMRSVSDLTVAEWLRGGENVGTVPALRAMFNDAASAKGGRLVDRNPFAKLGISRGRGRRDQTPPSEELVWRLIDAAHEITSPFFAAWLQVAAFTGMRPGELDALRWDAVDLDRQRIHVREQYSHRTRTYTSPKNGRTREAPLTKPARQALESLPRQADFCFIANRGKHLTASSRAYHWKAVRAAAGYDGPLYLATRHFAGSYMVNRLEMRPEDVAIALGHEDGGELVRTLYGHLDRADALNRVVDAYERRGEVATLALRGRR